MRGGCGAAGALLILLGAACGMPAAPSPAPRVAAVEPSGEGVSPSLAAVAARFSAPVSPDGLLDGRRMVLVPATMARAAVAAADSEEGAAGLPGAVPGAVALEDGGRRAVLRLAAPLHPLTPYVLVIGAGVRARDGRLVLDAAGRQRATAAEFETGAADGPPARPVIAELRPDAETPEAAGEYVVLVNLGEGALDLFGHRLEKRSPAGAVTTCALSEGAVAPGGLALVVGAAYDGRYLLPEGTVVVTCGASSLLGGLANDRFPALRLLDPRGAVLSSAGAGGGPVCAIAVRAALDGPDEAWNWECVETD